MAVVNHHTRTNRWQKKPQVGPQLWDVCLCECVAYGRAKDYMNKSSYWIVSQLDTDALSRYMARECSDEEVALTIVSGVGLSDDLPFFKCHVHLSDVQPLRLRLTLPTQPLDDTCPPSTLPPARFSSSSSSSSSCSSSSSSSSSSSIPFLSLSCFSSVEPGFAAQVCGGAASELDLVCPQERVDRSSRRAWKPDSDIRIHASDRSH